MAQLKITLVRGKAGTLPAQRGTLKALGLGKINSYAIREDSPIVRGMIRTVAHLVKVEEV